MAAMGHEQVVHCHNPVTGLKAIIAIHDTTLGPALGGLRMWPYADEGAALTDVLRLSRGMTYKNALAGLDMGGGKAVIIGDPKHDRDEALMRSFGRFLDALGGRYITAEDVGMSEREMGWILAETDWVVGNAPVRGGSGDPSPFTAAGTVAGIRASLRERFGDECLGDSTGALDGVGVDADAIFAAAADVFVPCALGGVVDDETVARLRCHIVAGAANNQLAEDRLGDALVERGIVYAPDYAINAGGVMNVALELDGYSSERARAMVERIDPNLTAIYALARREGIAPWRAADRLAEQRIEAMAAVAGSAPATPARPGRERLAPRR